MIELNMSRWGEFPNYLKDKGYKLGVEVGVEFGFFSQFLLKSIPDLKLYQVDIWENESNYEATARNLTGLNYEIIRDFSTNAAMRFGDGSLDFVYIDANHDFEHCYEDIVAWSPKVRVGGMVAGHDFINEPDQEIFVEDAVTKWVEEQGITNLTILKETKGNPSWFYIK